MGDNNNSTRNKLNFHWDKAVNIWAHIKDVVYPRFLLSGKRRKRNAVFLIKSDGNFLSTGTSFRKITTYKRKKTVVTNLEWFLLSFCILLPSEKSPRLHPLRLLSLWTHPEKYRITRLAQKETPSRVGPQGTHTIRGFSRNNFKNKDTVESILTCLFKPHVCFGCERNLRFQIYQEWILLPVDEKERTIKSR